MMLPIALVLLAQCAAILLWLCAAPRLAHAATGNDDRSAHRVLSVIIPARNEAHNLPLLLRTLQEQTRPSDEVIVVDDESTDDTAAVAKANGATVLTAGVRSANARVFGKPWSCAKGAQVAAGDLLMFLDADVQLAPGALSALRQCAVQYGGFVTVQPYHNMQRLYEQLSAFFNVVLLWSIPRQTRTQGAFGPVAVCTRADYERIGGHQTVYGKMLEHHALAAEFGKAGFAVHNFRGGDLIRFRMYPEGLATWLNGWQKSFAKGAAATGPMRLIAVSLWIAALCSCPRLVYALCSHQNTALSGVLLYLVTAGVALLGMRQAGRFHWYTGLLYPIPLAAFVAVFASSLIRTHVLRRVTWKGRRVTP